jgi:hypothetical protein
MTHNIVYHLFRSYEKTRAATASMSFTQSEFSPQSQPIATPFIPVEDPVSTVKSSKRKVEDLSDSEEDESSNKRVKIAFDECDQVQTHGQEEIEGSKNTLPGGEPLFSFHQNK